MKKILIVLFAMFLIGIVVSGCNVAVSPSDQKENTISATGVGESTVLPDEVSVLMAVETLADTAEESEQENSRIVDRVRNELFAIGIAASDVQTSNFNVYPEYDYSQDGRNQIGYRTSHSITVKTSQFSKIGRIIDAAVAGGVTSVYNIQFELSEGKQAEAKKQALEEASRDAREKAEAIASGLDVRLGKIVSVSSQDFYYNPRIAYAASAEESVMEAKEAATTIVPSELDTSAMVTVVFEIA